MPKIISDFIEYPDKIRYTNIMNKLDKRKFFITPTNNEIEGFRIKDNPEIAERDLNRLKNSILLQARYFDESTFKIHLYRLKHNLIESLFNGKPVYLNDFFTLDLLLAAVNNKKWNGRDKQIKKINGLVTKFFKRVEEINFLEDTMNRLYLLTDNHVLRMNYLENFMEQYSNYGLISHKEDPNKAFKFEEIDNLNNFGKKFTLGCDLLEVFKGHFRFMISLSNLFNIRENSSKFYAIELDNVDIAYLLSLFYSYGADSFVKVPEKILHEHFEKNYVREYKDYREFIKKVCTEESKFPIFIHNNGFYYISKHNLLFFILWAIYSTSQNGFIQDARMKASRVFENFLMNEFKDSFETPFKPSFKLSNSSYDYDIIAFSKLHKQIFLIESKYKDLPPSSMSGFNLIDHVLNGEKGLIEESKKHKLRKEYFIKNINKFSEIANCDLSKYEINMFIVTKYTPLIKRYDDIEIISFDCLRKRIKELST